MRRTKQLLAYIAKGIFLVQLFQPPDSDPTAMDVLDLVTLLACLRRRILRSAGRGKGRIEERSTPVDVRVTPTSHPSTRTFMCPESGVCLASDCCQQYHHGCSSGGEIHHV